MHVRLGRLLGTPIDVDGSFLLVAALFVITTMQPGQPIQYALMWAPIAFISVLLHELAHAAGNAVFGHGPSHVILGGFGGVTINDRPKHNWQVMLISVAGPLSSFALVLLCGWLLRLPAGRDPMLAAMLPAMARINVFWGIFNLLPVMPLDGSAVVHAALRMFLPADRAMRAAAWISIVVGVSAAVYFLVVLQMIFATLMLAMLVRVSVGALRVSRGEAPPPDSGATPGSPE